MATDTQGVNTQNFGIQNERPCYDVCLVLLYTVMNDARSLNIVRTLRDHGKRVCVIALGTEQDRQRLAEEEIVFVPLNGRTQGRFIVRWVDFVLQATWQIARMYISSLCSRVVPHSRMPRVEFLRAKTWWAADLYVLPLVVMMVRWITRQKQARIVYDAREVYSALGTVAAHPLKQFVITALERWCVRFVDEVCTSGDDDSDYVYELWRDIPHHQRDGKGRIRRPAVVMNLPPYKPIAALLSAVPHNRIRQHFELAETVRIVLYQGMIFHGRGLLHVVRALPHLESAVFVLLGEGAFESAVRAEAERCSVQHRVLFGGKIPYDELPLWTASADVGVALIEPISLSYQFALPNKLFEYCMAGIPTVASDLPAMKRVLERFSIGCTVPAQVLVDADESLHAASVVAQALEKCLSPQFRSDVRAVCEAASRVYAWEAQEGVVMSLACP